MSYLKYYRDENNRHQIPHKVVGDFQLITAMTIALFRHFQLKNIPVRLWDRKDKRFARKRATKSWYQPGLAREIVYHPQMLNALTVAHEVAHYAHDMEQRRRVDRWMEVRKTKGLVAGYLWADKPKAQKDHGPRHRWFVDEGVRALAAMPKFRALFQTGPSADVLRETQLLTRILTHGEPQVVADEAAARIQTFVDALPEKLTCPCCQAHIPKSNFGVRVMKRDSQGLPTVIRRQSYCRACR